MIKLQTKNSYWYQRSVEEVLHDLQSNVDIGLTTTQVKDRINQFGENDGQ